ncbi:MAG: MmcQ/YjbR family DNA-binding protein [Eubacteriales bacterium]|nr:MmcQ/YjbR family DNA-binding protein [Eubacteriales bacterium]
MSREEVFEYVRKQYGTVPEYLWKSDPFSAVLRHPNGKWYGIVMNIKKSALGLKDDMMADVINVKCEPDMTCLLTQTYGFFPGYHMNKKYWVTILLDETVSEAKVLNLLDMSYDLIDRKGKRPKGQS